MGKFDYPTPIWLLKWGANIALGIHIVVAISVLFVLLLAFGSDNGLTSSWPITNGKNLSSYALSAKSQSVGNLSIEVSEGVLSFTSTSAGYCVLKFADTAITLLLTLFILLLLRQVVGTLATQTPFCEANAKRLRMMAVLIMALTPHQLLQGFVYRLFVQNNILVEDAKFASFPFNSAVDSSNTIWLSSGLDLQPLFIGLLLLAIAEVFKIGVHLRQDSESIV